MRLPEYLSQQGQRVLDGLGRKVGKRLLEPVHLHGRNLPQRQIAQQRGNAMPANADGVLGPLARDFQIICAESFEYLIKAELGGFCRQLADPGLLDPLRTNIGGNGGGKFLAGPADFFPDELSVAGQAITDVIADVGLATMAATVMLSRIDAGIVGLAALARYGFLREVVLTVLTSRANFVKYRQDSFIKI